MVAKGGGVLSIIFSGLLVQLFLFIMWALNKRFPTKTLYEFVKAYHYQDWKKIDVEKEYPHIRFQAKADVEIIDHGIIN
jgi:hypothetical protein